MDEFNDSKRFRQRRLAIRFCGIQTDTRTHLFCSYGFCCLLLLLRRFCTNVFFLAITAACAYWLMVLCDKLKSTYSTHSTQYSTIHAQRTVCVYASVAKSLPCALCMDCCLMFLYRIAYCLVFFSFFLRLFSSFARDFM